MAAQRITLLDAVSISAAANGASFQVATLTMAHVTCELTSESSLVAFDLWLEGSTDGGTTWSWLACDHQQGLYASTIGEKTAAEHKRNIASVASANGVWAATYKHLPCDLIRVRYNLTSGSVTATVELVGK